VPTDRRVVVAIATPLEPDLVRTIGAVDDRLDVQYRPTCYRRLVTPVTIADSARSPEPRSSGNSGRR
jgi:hypothetical protein